jgi:hypothetical protein
MNYPYPKIAKLKYKDSYLDGGTEIYKVLNANEIHTIPDLSCIDYLHLFDKNCCMTSRQ